MSKSNKRSKNLTDDLLEKNDENDQQQAFYNAINNKTKLLKQ